MHPERITPNEYPQWSTTDKRRELEQLFYLNEQSDITDVPVKLIKIGTLFRPDLRTCVIRN
jgi:hypothetical protein